VVAEDDEQKADQSFIQSSFDISLLFYLGVFGPYCHIEYGSDRSVNTQNSCSPRCKLISQKKNL